MSKWDKLLEKIGSLSKDMRFNELRKVLESYGYEMHQPKGGQRPLDLSIGNPIVLRVSDNGSYFLMIFFKS